MIRLRCSSTQLASILACTSLMAALPSRAFANECGSDADCEHGFSCEVTALSTCPGIACPDGSNCPPVPPCENMEYRECVPAHDCSADSDCPSGMVCYEYSETSCWDSIAPRPAPGSGPTCPPDDEDCLASPPEKVAPPDTGCSQETVTACTPRWALPCAADSDCGEGFACTEIVEQWCDGGAAEPQPGTPTPTSPDDSSGSEDLAPPDEDPAPPERMPPPEQACGSAPTGRFRCEPKEITCGANSDCPESWLCKVTQSDSSGAQCGQAVNPDGTLGDLMCDPIAPEPPQAVKQCVPPYWDYGHGYGVGVAGPGSPGDDTGEATGAPHPTPQDSKDDPSTQGNVGTATPPTANPPRPAVTGDDGNAADPSGEESSESNDDGCHISHGPAKPGIAFLLAAMGLFGFSQRRRSREHGGHASA